ncbi:MAG: ROK family protein [Lewinellaceae bacterium]|nr:ROK family protein [Lewinellaceae bacterium]
MSPPHIAIDIGGTAIKFSLTNLRGDILWESITPTPGSSGTAIVETVLRCIHQCGAGQRTPRRQLHRYRHAASWMYPPGSSLSGMPDLALGKCYPLATIITRETELPAFVDNDANLMGLGKYVFGKTAK